MLSIKQTKTPLIQALEHQKPFSDQFTIHHNVPLHDKNWFRSGGSARYFAEPTTAAEFQQALAFARDHHLSVFVLGHGANILISDEGFDGLVIRPQLHNITITEHDKQVLVQAGSGVSMHELISFCLQHQIGGLEEFSGIPGTVGGSVYINLHYFEFLLSQFLVEAVVIEKETGILQHVTTAWFNFGYNNSTLVHEPYYLVQATFKLTKLSELETAYAYGRHVEIIRHREKRYPSLNTCGSFFRNFNEQEVAHVPKKLIYVAYYLDNVGIKGSLRVGGAMVSHQHANMIINTGNATSTDIITLARTMQEMVYDKFGIIPQPECRLIGFKEHPLLLR